MKKLIIILLLMLIFGCSSKSEKINTAEQAIQDTSAQMIEKQQTMKITSPEFNNNEKIPSEYTCDGNNISPQLKISDVPKEAKSLVLIMDDPDAIKPANKVWDHWIVFNIPTNTIEIPKNKEPEGIHGTGTSGNLNYVGPCPPDKEHRYFFKLYALGIKLNLEDGSTKKQVEDAMQDHILAQATLIGKYERQ